jgi:hypothetical protein
MDNSAKALFLERDCAVASLCDKFTVWGWWGWQTKLIRSWIIEGDDKDMNEPGGLSYISEAHFFAIVDPRDGSLALGHDVVVHDVVG